MDGSTLPGVDVELHPSDFDTACRILSNHIERLDLALAKDPDNLLQLQTVWNGDCVAACKRMDDALVDLKHGKLSLERTIMRITMWAQRVELAIKVFCDDGRRADLGGSMEEI